MHKANLAMYVGIAIGLFGAAIHVSLAAFTFGLIDFVFPIVFAGAFAWVYRFDFAELGIMAAVGGIAWTFTLDLLYLATNFNGGGFNALVGLAATVSNFFLVAALSFAGGLLTFIPKRRRR